MLKVIQGQAYGVHYHGADGFASVASVPLFCVFLESCDTLVVKCHAHYGFSDHGQAIEYSIICIWAFLPTKTAFANSMRASR